MKQSSLPTNSVVCNSDFEIGLSDWHKVQMGEQSMLLVKTVPFKMDPLPLKQPSQIPPMDNPYFQVVNPILMKIKIWNLILTKSDNGGESVVATSSLSAAPIPIMGKAIYNKCMDRAFICCRVRHHCIQQCSACQVQISQWRCLLHWQCNHWGSSTTTIFVMVILNQAFQTDSNCKQRSNSSVSVTPSQAQNGFQSAMVLLNTPGSTNGSVQLSLPNWCGTRSNIYRKFLLKDRHQI